MRYYIAFGANLGDRADTFRRVIAAVESLLAPVERVSKLYRTAPLNPPELQESSQPEFLNGAFALRSARPPLEVLDILLGIERELGRDRERTVRWGPRTVDLDIIAIDDLTLSEPRLTVPHPEMHNRDFVLIPLADIDPAWVHPRFAKSVSALIEELHRGDRPTFMTAVEG